MNRLEAVTFDCWNTLLREQDSRIPRAARAAALVEIAGGAGVEVSSEDAAAALARAFDRHVELWERGIASGAPEIARWALEGIGVAGGGAARLLAARLAEASLGGGSEALPGAGDALERLRSRGVRTALVCDTGMSPGRVVRSLLARAGLLSLLEVQVFSDEIGVPKPHPRMFEAALDPLGIAAARAVHVGDLRRTDVQGGRGYGMGTVRIRAVFDDGAPLPDADAVIGAHDELAAVLDAIAARR